MPQGKIKKLTQKGFGFIERANEDDLFFHATKLDEGLQFDDLNEGDAVEFAIGKGERGPHAECVRRA